MQEIAKITLENEMDLILAHKRSMKLAELAGLSLSAQTTFATAVSEICRYPIETGRMASLVLSVDNGKRDKYIVACLRGEQRDSEKSREGLEYAKRLVNKYNVSTSDNETSIELFYYVSPAFRIDITKLDEWRTIFRNEPPVSPYEELKRKNEMLYELSEKLRKSDSQYRTVTNSLPLFIFSITATGDLFYANDWFLQFTGETIESLNASKWKTVIHEEDYDSFSLLLKTDITKQFSTIKSQTRLKNREGNEYVWHQVSLSPFKNEKDELQYWIGYMADIHKQKAFEETLQDNIELKETQKQLRENQEAMSGYIVELNRSNHELQQFAFVASHDLQEPVRKLMFYSDYLLQKYASGLDGRAAEFLSGMHTAAQRMRTLIQDLLTFSQIDKQEISVSNVDLNQVINEAIQDLEISIEEKNAAVNIDKLPVISGDKGMLRQLFENIISNSLKYSNPAHRPQIDIGYSKINGSHIISFKDNGIGFNEKYLPQMFALFQRLHNKSEYEGTGLGLAICRKIIEMHNGKIWAKGEEGQGATFFISLPVHVPETI
jgi:PAS domain S-box-containing protein